MLGSPGYRPSVSQTQILVMRACSPHLAEPNYALHLEVAEYVNQKKANMYVQLHYLDTKAEHNVIDHAR